MSRPSSTDAAVEFYSPEYLRLRVPDPEDAAARIRGARLDSDGVLVPWDLPTVRRLTSLHLPVISPMAYEYEWPSYKPKIPAPMPHQIKGADFLVRNPRSFFFGGIGVGKTISTLWAADYLIQKGEVGRVLVVCPLSIINESWGDTIKTHFRHLSYTALVGTAAKRKQLVRNPTSIHIINFDGVPVIRDELAEVGYDLVVIDESTAYKNPSTQRWKTLNSIIDPLGLLWLLTGTPVPQGPMDAFGQAKLVNPTMRYRTQMMFKMATMYQVTDFKWVPKPESAGIVKDVLSPAIYIDKRQVLKDLPPVTSLFRQVDVTPAQKRAFDKMRMVMQTVEEGAKITAANAAVQLCKLLQILAGTVYDDEGEVVSFDNKPRINEMIGLLEQSQSKSLVYVPFLHVLESCAAAMDKAGIRYEIIYGGVPRKERERIFKEFQTEDTFDCILAIPHAMAHGVTATAASTVVWFMPQPRHEIYTQASGRVDRTGQKLPVTLAHLYGHAIEKKMYEAQQSAQGYEHEILSLYKSLVGS